MNRGHRVRPLGRIDFRADDGSLTLYAGLAVVGALARRLGLVGLIDGELACERRAAPVKVRKRGVSAGELVVALAESQLSAASALTTSSGCAPIVPAARSRHGVSVVRAARSSRFAADRVFLVKPFEKPLEGHRNVG